MTRPLLCLFASLVAGAASALSLGDFAAVHKARLTVEGPNRVRLELPSAEWDSGLRLQADPPLDLSRAKWLAVDVENLSATRQARLTLHLSAGGTGGDSGDHAAAIQKRNRSINTGIGLNPGEKGVMRLLLPHPSVYGAPAHARGPYVVDTAHVTRLELKMQWPFEDEAEGLADLRLSDLRLEGEPDTARFVPPETYVPFVDRYGQFAHADWKFKIHSDAELAGDLVRETARLRPAPASWDRFGGWAQGPVLKATGHFRTEKVGGKWWLVTPEGRLFFSTGIDVTRIMTDVTDGRRHPEWFQGGVPADGKMAFTVWNLEKKFGKKDFAADYYGLVLRRFDAWGMNTIGNWSAPELTRTGRKPYVITVFELGRDEPRLGKNKIYDSLDPRFAGAMQAAVRARFASDPALRTAATDPMCIGFFIDNELRFPKDAAYYEPYFRACGEAIRANAPGKLYLGCRFVGFRQSAALWAAAARHCDVISVNSYGNSVANISGRIFSADGVEKPLLVGEFHFGCLDRGMFKPGLAPVCDQAERGRAYARYVEGALKHPLIVGCHWFQYRDQPLLGRGDGEAYQIGFVDVCDRPYPELFRAARRVGETMYERRRADTW